MKNNNISKKELLEQICRMYYILDKSQLDIAKQLKIGRSSVARFLKESRDLNIIKFHISDDINYYRNLNLERLLINNFQLQDAVVINEINGNFEEIAVDYLNSILPYKGILGLNWGHTIFEISKVVQRCNLRPDLEIIQMIGNPGSKEQDMPSASIIQNWSKALNAKPFYLPAPVLTETKAIKETFINEKNIQESLHKISNIDISITSIGNLSFNSTIAKSKLLTDNELKTLQKKSVGEINLRFINRKGEFIDNSVSNRVIGALPENLLNIPTRVIIVKEIEKYLALKSALNGNLADVIIITKDLGDCLLKNNY